MVKHTQIPGRLALLVLVGFVIVAYWGGLPVPWGNTVVMDSATSNAVIGLVDSSGVGVSGQIYRISPACYASGRVVSCSGNNSVDGIVLLADIANPGNTDFYGTLKDIVVTPVDPEEDSKLAAIFNAAINGDMSSISAGFILSTGKEITIKTQGAYAGNKIPALIPAGGQGIWASVVDFAHSHANGNVVYSYTVCAQGIDGGEQCVSQEPLEIAITPEHQVSITKWGSHR